MTSIDLSAKEPAGLPAEALVVGVVKDGQGIRIADPDRFSGPVAAALLEAAQAAGADGAASSVQRIPAPAGVTAAAVVFVGLGDLPPGARAEAEVLRRGAGAAAMSLRGAESAIFALPALEPAEVAAVAEGALLGAYEVRETTTPLASVTLATSLRSKQVRQSVRRAQVLASAVHGTRDLVNLSPNVLYPETFAARAKALAKGTKVKVSVLAEASLRSGGFGGILGVGQGSQRPPRLVKVTYTPSHPRAHYALVGKGITFDSGGLSLKPPAGMITMKMDMAGAAAVLHTVLAAAELALPVQVTGWLALAENMPSGTAQRPSDVITMHGGRTVEVLNTDAEGRLVLADAIAAAGEEGPDAIIDIATLTGAQMVALGNEVGAVMGTEDLRGKVVQAAQSAGEQLWPMPLPAELRSSLDTPVADIANIGSREGGMLVAGLFLQEFTGQRPWAHVDIAGPAFNSEQERHYLARGGTGMGVRTLLRVLEEAAGR